MSSPAFRTRVLVLAAILAVAFGSVALRLGWLQLVRSGELSAMAERQYSRTVVLHAQRGPIVDRHGAPLATSTAAESLFAQPRQVGDPVRVAERLAPLLDTPAADLHAALVSGKPFVWLKRRIEPAITARIKDLREPGLGFLPEPLRLYPNRELAAHVVGFEGVDGGLEGIERAWNAELVGAPGKALVGRDALGRDVVHQQILQSSAPGRGVMLTIDRTIQHIAEREVDAAFRRTGSKAAMAVVMDPKTGDMLAIAIRPTFNPNTFMDATREAWRNRSVTDPFEPGSTFKAILAAAALEEGVVSPDERIYAENGRITIARATIHDWKKYGWLSFAEVLQNSSNVGSIKVGLSLGRERYYRYMTAFGFGALTNVGFAGESRGLLREPGRWSQLSLPTMSIGQEISVTAVQMVAAFGAIANGGTLMQPRIVRSVFDASGREVKRVEPRAVRQVVSPDTAKTVTRLLVGVVAGGTLVHPRIVRSVFDASGREVKRVEPRAVRQVVSPDTAKTLTRLLVGVVAGGTGRHAAIPGYDVAGKTGTAQKLDPGAKRYSRAPGVLSFVGFAPADDPKFVMLVMLDEPKNEKWGSEAAAPIFSAIGREVLRYLEVPRQDTPPVQIVTGPGPESLAPRVRLVSSAPDSTATAVRSMPDVRGRTLREALATLAPLDVEIEAQGQGRVTAQQPLPGTPVEPGARASLALAPSRP